MVKNRLEDAPPIGGQPEFLRKTVDGHDLIIDGSRIMRATNQVGCRRIGMGVGKFLASCIN
jgi:hypothetical protein